MAPANNITQHIWREAFSYKERREKCGTLEVVGARPFIDVTECVWMTAGRRADHQPAPTSALTSALSRVWITYHNNTTNDYQAIGRLQLGQNRTSLQSLNLFSFYSTSSSLVIIITIIICV